MPKLGGSSKSLALVDDSTNSTKVEMGAVVDPPAVASPLASLEPTTDHDSPVSMPAQKMDDMRSAKLPPPPQVWQ